MPISTNFIPTTVLEAVNNIVNGIDAEEKKTMLETQSGEHHFFGGMALRNSLGLWEKDNAVKRDAVATYRIAHADDLSALILEWVWALVRGEKFDPQETCQRFHDHWKKYAGMSSLQAGGFNDDGTPMSEQEQKELYSRHRA
jgi:hypothetical protein